MVKPKADDALVGGVKSAHRALTLLEYLAEVRQASFSDIVRDLELPYSSTHQLLQTVLSHGFIELDSTTRFYRLGLRLWEVAQSYEMAEDLAATAQPLMDDLRDRTRETVQLARLDGWHNVYLAISESPHPMKLTSSIGARLPAHATGLGKVLLAGLPQEELERRLDKADLTRFTDQTLTTRNVLRTALDEIRVIGFGEDNEEYVVGCRCIAMPVKDRLGNAVVAMSVSIPTPRFDEAVARRVHAALSDTVSQLERHLRADQASSP